MNEGLHRYKIINKDWDLLKGVQFPSGDKSSRQKPEIQNPTLKAVFKEKIPLHDAKSY